MTEWRRITIAQIRRRIREMPWRCEQLIKMEGARIRSKTWQINSFNLLYSHFVMCARTSAQ